MKNHHRIIQTLLLFLAFTTSVLGVVTWDISQDYSAASNPNGAWSYGRKWSVEATAMDLFAGRWGDGGLYLGNADGSPSIYGGPHMWAGVNRNGYPCVRWTCPKTGHYNIGGRFLGDDDRGADSYIYVIVNGSITFSDRVVAYLQSATFSFESTFLRTGDLVDFVLTWGGVGFYGWTDLDAIISKVVSPVTATATATVVNGFVVGTPIKDPGYGYTNAPGVRFIGGGGSGAQAVTVVSNTMVTAVNILNPGSGYTNAPVVVIEPPFIPQPTLRLNPLSELRFTNLIVGTNYQLQAGVGGNLADAGPKFAATSATFTQLVPGNAIAAGYRLAVTPVPTQAQGTA